MRWMRFPGFKGKALTLSYDDGVVQDIRLVEIMKKYGMDEQDVYDGLNNEIFDNWVFQYYSKRYVSHDYWTGFSLDNGIKDLSYMKRLYEEQNIPGFVLDGALDLARVTKLQENEGEKLEMAHMARTMYRLLGFEN